MSLPLNWKQVAFQWNPEGSQDLHKARNIFSHFWWTAWSVETGDCYFWCISSLLLCAGSRATCAAQCLIFILHGSQCMPSCVSAQDKALLVRGMHTRKRYSFSGSSSLRVYSSGSEQHPRKLSPARMSFDRKARCAWGAELSRGVSIFMPEFVLPFCQSPAGGSFPSPEIQRNFPPQGTRNWRKVNRLDWLHTTFMQGKK